MRPEEDIKLITARHHLESTKDEPESRKSQDAVQALPGVVLIFAHRRPTQRVFVVGRGSVTLGRMELVEGSALDAAISREHVRLTCDGPTWRVLDLGSRNGTSINGITLSGETQVPSGSMIRVGGALLLVLNDVLPFKQFGITLRGGIVAGPILRQELESVALASREAMVNSLLIIGETGSGKEIAAKTFHAAAAKPNGPFVALNCATIPKELAERLLFGSQRGAFSGATDAQGYVQAADGGTLFLDEVAELPLDVQSKLLRMLETREVLRLGATAYERVNVRVCAATFRDLREEVGAGRFREDLYFRIAQAEVRLPALRQRLEEIPWHIQHVLDEVGQNCTLSATVGFVEACAMRSWPGNVRELRAEVRRAAAMAITKGTDLLSSDELAPTAGKPIPRPRPSEPPSAFPSDEFASALAQAAGNVALAARTLGVHRNKVRRWLERHHVDPTQFKSAR